MRRWWKTRPPGRAWSRWLRPPGRPRRGIHRGHDEGAATLYALGIGLLFVLLGLAVALRGSGLVDRAQAQTAADLGALAGAIRVGEGSVSACAVASTVVARNGAAVIRCLLSGLDLTLTVKLGSASATARAGPIRTPPEPGDVA